MYSKCDTGIEEAYILNRQRRDLNRFPNKPWFFTCLHYKFFENTVGKGEIWFKHILLPYSVILTINIQMNTCRQDSFYRQRGLATSSANLNSTIPLDYLHILYIFVFYCSILKYFYTAKTKDETFPGYEFNVIFKTEIG